MVKRYVILVFSFLLSSGSILAQRRIEYSYDNNGNRDSRILVVAQLKSATTDYQDSLKVDEETNNKNAEKYIRVFPNPVQTSLTIQIKGYDDVQKMNAGVFNMTGKKLEENIISSEYTLELGTLQDGIYILRITIGDEIFQYKIIKSN